MNIQNFNINVYAFYIGFIDAIQYSVATDKAAKTPNILMENLLIFTININ